MKTIERNPPRNQHLRNFNATHDLTKASTTRINYKQAPQRSDGHSSCNPKQEVA